MALELIQVAHTDFREQLLSRVRELWTEPCPTQLLAYPLESQRTEQNFTYLHKWG